MPLRDNGPAAPGRFDRPLSRGRYFLSDLDPRLPLAAPWGSGRTGLGMEFRCVKCDVTVVPTSGRLTALGAARAEAGRSNGTARYCSFRECRAIGGQ
jgi:hypothetical protein